MLSDEHRLLRDSLRDFAQQRLAPFAAEWDRNATFPKETLAELAALLKNKEQFKGQKVGIILSGGNVDLGKLPF